MDAKGVRRGRGQGGREGNIIVGRNEAGPKLVRAPPRRLAAGHASWHPPGEIAGPVAFRLEGREAGLAGELAQTPTAVDQRHVEDAGYWRGRVCDRDHDRLNRLVQRQIEGTAMTGVTDDPPADLHVDGG